MVKSKQEQAKISQSDNAKIAREADEGQKPKKVAKCFHPMPGVMRVLLTVLMLLILALIFTWFVLWRQYGNDGEAVKAFIEEKPALFSYSALVIFLILATLAAFLWRPFLASGIIFAVLSVITYASEQKYAARQVPLVPGDFQLIDGTLLEFVEAGDIVRLAIGIVLVLLASILLEYFARKIIGRDKKRLSWWEKHSIVPRVTLGMISLAALTLLVNPIIHKSKDEDIAAWLEGVKFDLCNQTINYSNNGYIIAFMYDLGSLNLEMPEGYSEEAIKTIAEKYQNLKTEDDADRKPLADVVDNVIFIMDESFYDPAVLGEHYAHAGGDVIPNLHKIFEKYPSGYMYSPEYGGNTANVEFSAMTGLSNYWAQTVPYATFASKMALPGLASLANENGFKTIAFHPYSNTMYKRNLVYPAMGYDEFIYEDTMDEDIKEAENGNGFISDKSVYNQIMRLLKSEDQPQLISAITIQNHMPFDLAQYSTNRFAVTDANVTNWYNVEKTYENMHHADQYLGDFIKELDKLDEKTVVIWFGDHAAGVLNDYVDSDDQDLINLAHLTPYFVYANFDIDSEYTAKEVAKMNQELGFDFSMVTGVDLPTVSPNCLLNTMYDILGTQKPPLMYLLDAVCEETPVLAPSFYSDDDPLEVTDALSEYEMINYDISSGKRYWLGAGLWS